MAAIDQHALYDKFEAGEQRKEGIEDEREEFFRTVAHKALNIRLPLKRRPMNIDASRTGMSPLATAVVALAAGLPGMALLYREYRQQQPAPAPPPAATSCDHTKRMQVIIYDQQGNPVPIPHKSQLTKGTD